MITMNKPKYNNKDKFKNKPNKGKGKGKKDGISKPVTGNDIVSDRVNNPSYYFDDPLLKQQVSNISFNQFVNTVETIPLADGQSAELRLPSIMSINLNPSAGFDDPANGALGSGLNMSALGLYTYLTANNAKTSDYGPQDVATMLLAMGSIIEHASYCTRFFGMPYLYNARNKAFPKRLVEAAGCDYDDLVANYANYRIRFNSIMAQAGNIPIPANITYFDKCKDLYSGIYLDAPDTPMAQIYMFKPNSVWQMDESSYDQGTILKPIPYNVTTEGGYLQMNDYLYQLESMLASVMTSVTLQKVFADILRVSQKEGMPLYAFTGVPDNYVVIPSYVPEISLWIHNMTIMGEPITAESGYELPDGYTSGNYVLPDMNRSKLIYKPKFRVGSNKFTTYDPIMNFPIADPSSDLIIEATRLMCGKVSTADENGVYYTEAVALPDHYCTSIELYTMDDKRVVTTNTQMVEVEPVTTVSYISNFKWAPIIMSVSPSRDRINGIFANLQYYTTVDYDYLRALQDTTYLGLFKVR